MNKYDAMDTDEALNAICEQVTKPDTLNALHACRSERMTSAYQWRNAHALMAQNKFFSGIQEVVVWLRDKADDEQVEQERAYERQMVGDRDFTPPYEP